MNDQNPNHESENPTPDGSDRPRSWDDTRAFGRPGQPGQPGQSPYGHGSGYAQPTYGQGYYGSHPQGEQRRPARPTNTFTAGLLAAALIVGGLGGLAGAAGFAAVDYLNGDGPGSASAAPATSSSVVNRKDTAAEPGSVEAVAQSVLPSVVQIKVRGMQAAGSGSGIVIGSDGEILTNNHVVEVAAGGGTMSVNFNDGSAAPAHVIGTDPVTDLAVIKAEGVSGLTPATLGKSANVDVGEQVVAVGSPFGLEATVTSGIVSALNRPVSVGSAGPGATDTTYPAIQTDAAINPGNSGGPLVNMQSEVIGINSSIRTSSSMGEGGSIGLGFAIPIDKVMPIVDQLRNGETPTHARLGVTVTDATSQNGLFSGAGIRQVAPGTAAAKAGLESGDVVTKVDDHAVSGSESLVATIRGYRPGDQVTLTVVRNGNDTKTVDVTLGSDQGTASS
jgi:putative serine protease PepD